MRERRLDVDYTTIFHWVRRYASEINKRIRPYLKMSGTSYQVQVKQASEGGSAARLMQTVR